jgi:UDP:flavonoid glycosyltransferase YjiC (YdhE family)
LAKTALFAWELGSHLGHASPMAEIARSLESDGVRVVAAGRELASLRIAFSGLNALLLQAPVWPGHRHFGNEVTQASFLDVLVNAGFAAPDKLASVVTGWRAVIELVKPDIIIADHSPGLMVAAYGGAVPVLSVGTGFTMPPLELGRFPPLRAHRAPIVPEAQVLAGLSPILAEAGVAPPDTLTRLFKGTERFVFSFPELDPFRTFRQETLYLPPEPLPGFVDPPVAPRVFVYLGSENPTLESIVQSLVESDLSIIAYLRGDVGPLSDFLAMRGHEVHKTPPKLADTLPRVSHVLSGGGSFTCHAALAAGRPHLVAPGHNESSLNLGFIEGLGTGKAMPFDRDARRLVNVLDAFIQDHGLLQNARHWAEVIAMRQQPSGAEAVRTAIHRHLS